MTAAAQVELYSCPTLQARIMPAQCERNRERYRAAQKTKGFDSEKIATVRMKDCLKCPGVVQISKGEAVAVNRVKADSPSDRRAPNRHARAQARTRYSVLGGTPTPKEEPMAELKKCKHGHVQDQKNRGVRKTGKSFCRVCQRESVRKSVAKRKAREADGAPRQPAAAPTTGPPNGNDTIDTMVEKLRLRRGELIDEAAKIDTAIEAFEGLRP